MRYRSPSPTPTQPKPSFDFETYKQNLHSKCLGNVVMYTEVVTTTMALFEGYVCALHSIFLQFVSRKIKLIKCCFTCTCYDTVSNLFAVCVICQPIHIKIIS